MSKAPQLVRPTYSLVPAVQPDPDISSRAPGIVGEVAAKWRLGWAPKVWNRVSAALNEPDPNFNPWAGIEGYEEFAEDLARASSQAEQDDLKRLIDNSRRDREIAARGEWGLISDLMAGVADPANLIPVPIVKGIGLVRGAATFAAANAGIAAGTETLRMAADPTVTPGEMVGTIGVASLLGGILGAPVGAWGARHRAAMRDFERLLSDVDGANPSLMVRGQDEGIRIEMGDRPLKGVDGTRERISVADEPGAYAIRLGPDGKNYVFEDATGWMLAEDRGREKIRPVGGDILEALGLPERTVERVMRVDEAALRMEFEDGGWRDGVRAMLGDSDPDAVIRTANDYVNFRVRERLWRDRLPRQAKETDEAFAIRAGKEAIDELQASRADAGLASAKGMEWVLDRLNLSPVAKAMRVFKGDNVVADVALRLGGDYGWAIKANEFGFRTPPSILLKAMRHTARWTKFRAEFDQEWLRYVTGQKDAVGKTVQSFNVSASFEAMRQRGRRAIGQNVLTYDGFAEMVGRAVYTKGDFTVNGHHVNEHARKAAAAYTRMMEEYEDMLREHGMFSDVKGLERRLRKAEEERLRLKDRVAQWLWKDGEPSALTPAIRVRTAEPATDPLLVEFDRLARITSSAEKQSDPATWTPEERAASAAGDWELFSRLRGYTDQEIADFRAWLDVADRVIAKYGEDFAAARSAGLDLAEPPPIDEFTQRRTEKRVTELMNSLDPEVRTALETGVEFRWSDIPEELFLAFDRWARVVFPDDERLDEALSSTDTFIRFMAERQQANDNAPAPRSAAGVERVYTGRTHGEAIRKMVDELGEEGFRLSEELTERDHGYVRTGDDFRTVDEAIEERVASLSAKQRKIYDERRASLDEIEETIAGIESGLEIARANPHRFADSAGSPEPYFSRYFDKSAIVTRREAFTRLLTRWYERDAPHGAEARAVDTVDNILTGDVGSARDIGSMRFLNNRSLHIPNSWSIVDPELGEIAMADFIDNNVLAVSETYVRRSGARIEVARAFGDPDMAIEKARLSDYLLERYFEPETTPEGRQAARQKIMEVRGWLDIVARSLTGTLRTGDPWSHGNRHARWMMDLTALSVMGKVLFTALPEMMRPAMVNGFGTAFRSIFMRYLDDLEKVRGNVEFLRLSGEIDDLARTRANARIMEMHQGETTTGGTWFERELAARVPGFFKMTGLTSWTVWVKEWTMIAAQHSVMADAQRIAKAVGEGGRPSAEDALRLAALGINARDALLLASMPVEVRDGGSLIMPAIDNWPKTAEGRQAREALLTAIHAEARRAIVTPAIGDKSTVFEGVWASKGRVKAETDIMRLPMQFLSYGVAAHNKILTSALQGRDRSAIGGMFFMLLGGILAQYLKLNENAWRNKTYDEILLEGWEAAGIGGFWFGDLSNNIEQWSGNRFGLRPALGMDPKFGRGTEMDGMIDAIGAAPSHFFDVSRAFWDADLSASQRAQLIRRGIPYNNVIWWGGIARNMAGEAGAAFEGNR